MHKIIIATAIAAALTLGATPAFAAPGGNGNGNAGQQQGNNGSNGNGQGNGGNSGDHAHGGNGPVETPPVVTPPMETPPAPQDEADAPEETIEVPAATPAADEASTPSVAAGASTDEENAGNTCADLRAGGAAYRATLALMVALGHCPR